jgi:GNAT superfamily N-acetyltransferase
MSYEVYTLSRDSKNFDKYSEQLNSWSIGLWFPDFEESNAERCYLVFDESENSEDQDFPVGFQTINGDGNCVAIEVHPDHQGKGLALRLIEESGCYEPDRDENPEFWATVKEKFNF